MLSWPDFKEKQIVLINSDQLKQLSLQNDNLLVKDEEWKTINKLSVYKIFSIFVIWDFTITSKLITKLLEFGISIQVLWYNLRPKFTIWNPLEGNFLLREKQYNFPYNLEYAKQLIFQKTTNQLKLLQKIRQKDSKLKTDIKKIKELIQKIENIDNFDSLRWIEGNVAKLYFQNYFKDYNRTSRSPRTKKDITNLLMDMWYTYLFYFIEANLNLYGFDIYKGVFHTQFFERKSLVCDLQEPFRPIIDRKIKNAYALKQINEKDFKFKNGVYTLPFQNHSKYSALFLEELLKRKEEIFKYIREFYLTMFKQEKVLPVFEI